MITIINGKITTAQNFAYDGCHKIYLIEDMADMLEVQNTSYKIYPITDLEKIWNESCSLRFINNWKLDNDFVNQFENAKFKTITCAEYNDTPFFYGKRLKALIIVGYNKDKKQVEYYRVQCFYKRHELLKEKIFNATDNNAYKMAYSYALNYLNNECKY